MKQYKITENNVIYDVKEDTNLSKWWYLNNKLHRENGPAIEYISGDKGWYLNGNIHRDDGPAVELTNGYKEYWFNNRLLKNIKTDEELIRYIKLLSIS